MDIKQLEAFAKEAAKSIKSESDLNDFRQVLSKIAIETALNAELEEHLGYEKNARSPSGNRRNGCSIKQLSTEDGSLEIETPRDREGSFEPQLVKKRQTRFASLNDKIISLYAKGMTTREIVATFKEMYDADVSETLISKVTDSVMERVTEWQCRPLAPVYPIVYLDCIMVKIRHSGQVINKAVYLALGLNLEGKKDLLGLWIAETEGAKFWLNVLTDLQNRGVQDILIACVDGLKGFPEAINAVFPQTQIQLCVVHMIRNSLKYVSYKDYKAVTGDLKQIYQAATEDEGLLALERFSDRWDDQYPLISKSWLNNWQNLSTLFSYPMDIRRAIYTTNAIESVNSVIRKAIIKRKVFPTDDSAKKVIYLAIQEASKKWTMPIRNWKGALNRFLILFEDRLAGHI